jgi:acyl-CoA synthetase (AMP-forming)/AMP-acid ligase II
MGGQIATWASHKGLKVGDAVALMMDNRPEYVCVWLGLAKIGVTVALINTSLRGKSLLHCIREAHSRCDMV